MLRVALRNVRAHLVRLGLSILAVVLGVSFVAGTFSLREMLSSTFDGIVDAGSSSDVYLRGGRTPQHSRRRTRARARSATRSRPHSPRPSRGRRRRARLRRLHRSVGARRGGRHPPPTTGAPTFGLAWRAADPRRRSRRARRRRAAGSSCSRPARPRPAASASGTPRRSSWQAGSPRPP
ncbi:hypothetical protein NKG05_16075 [Oerskovia sp. M15]